MKYCHNCGKELFDEAVFCPDCKYSFRNDYSLKIIYEDDVFLYKAKITVVIDNTNKHILKMGDDLVVTLLEGKHSVFVKMGFRKKTCNINLQHDVVLKVEVNRVTGGVDISEMIQ